MKKAMRVLCGILVVVIGLCMVCPSFAASDPNDYTYNGELTIDAGGILNIKHGKLQIGSTEVTASAAELNIMDGVTATYSEINAAADASARMTTATVTNGATLTLSATTPYIVVTASGSAENATNTITLATPYPVGIEFTIIAAGGNTNLIGIADSTTVFAAGANVLLVPTDVLKFFTTATNAASEVSTSDN